MSLLRVREAFIRGCLKGPQELPPSLSACAMCSVRGAEEGRCQLRRRAEAKASHSGRSQPFGGMGLWRVLGDLASSVVLLCLSAAGRNYQ